MSEETVRVLIYSDDASRRRAVIEGVGAYPAKGLPRVEWVEAATPDGTVLKFESESPQVLVLDGESPKAGGMSVAKELINEHDAQQPIVLLTARPQDRWLGEWSGATVIVNDPLDPIELQEALSTVIRDLP